MTVVLVCHSHWDSVFFCGLSLASITAKSVAGQAASSTFWSYPSHIRAPREGVRKGKVNSQPNQGLRKSELIANVDARLSLLGVLERLTHGPSHGLSRSPTWLCGIARLLRTTPPKLA
eukprot:72071-Amphidinium_carterae.1